MWKRQGVVSSSDESPEEEFSPGISGGFETAIGACKLKPVFDNIFADIQANIPTLDLEDSSEESNDNEEPLLFTRKVWPLAPNILSQVSLPISKPVGSSSASTSDSGVSFASTDRQTASHSSLSDSEPESIDVFLSSSPMSPSTLQHKSGTSRSIPPTSAGMKLPSSLYKTESATSSTATVDHADAQDTVKLNFDLIEHLNLGDLLQRTSEVTVAPLFPSILSDSENSDSEDSGNSLMEELVRLSKKQQNAAAPEPISPMQPHSPSASESIEQETHDVGVMSGPSVTSTGVTTCLDPSTQGRSKGTVFLDLRNLEKESSQRQQTLPSSICRILGISNEPEDLSSSSDEDDDWQDHRRKAKEASLSCVKKSNSTVDHRLPRKPATKQQGVAEERKLECKEILERLHEKVVQPVVVKEDTRGGMETGKGMVESGTSTRPNNPQLSMRNNHEVLKAERIHVSRQAWVDEPPVSKEEKPQLGNSIIRKNETKRDNSPAQVKTPPSPPKGDAITVNGVIAPSKRNDLSSVNSQFKNDLISPRNEEIKKTIVKQRQVLNEEEKAKRQRLQSSLQNLKPQLSSRGHHPAAPATPVLFHEEASYESDTTNLPDLDASSSYLLLSTKLSSCGELTTIRQGFRGELTPETHCFSQLVAWLACLTCPSVNATDYAELCGTPFYVVGLQQSWHDGQLKVEIGICRRLIKGENQKKIKVNSFRQAVNKFLSTNSLHSVYSRLSEFNPYPFQHISELLISKKNLSTLLTVNPDPDAMNRVFDSKPGFFWQTMEVEDALSDDKTGSRLYQGPEMQTTVMLMQFAVFHEPFCLLDVMVRARSKALDVAGIRLVYQQRELLEEKTAQTFQLPSMMALEEMSTDSQVPVFLLALRGPQAISRWQDEMGPVDSKLAQRTDPNSLRALYSYGTKEDHLFWCPRNEQSAGRELARWFGGRVPENGVVNIGSNEPILTSDETPNGSSSSKGCHTNSHLLTSSLHTLSRPPPHLLTTTTDTCIFLIVSRTVPVKYLGQIFCLCFEKGFCIQGIKRLRLNPNHFSGLGLAPEALSVYCPKRGSQSESVLHNPSRIASTVFLLRRENAIHHTLSVVKPLSDSTGLPQSFFLAVSFSDSMFKQLGGDFFHTPDPAAYPVDLLRHAFHTNPELEQVCVVTLLREKATISASAVLKDLLEDESSDLNAKASLSCCGFELLGLKLLPSLSMYQAKEFTPCKIGDASWKRSLRIITSGPALVLAVRGVDAFARLQRFVNFRSDSSKSKVLKDSILLDIFMSCTPEMACRQLSVIFFDRELFSDQSARRNLHLLPPPRRVTTAGSLSGSSESLNEAEASRKQRNRRVGFGNLPLKASLGGVETLQHGNVSVLQSLLEKPRVIPTVCVLKPRVSTKHFGRVLKRLGQENFSVVGLKMMSLTPADVKILMTKQEKDLERHVSHMTSGPVVVLCLQRENAVGRLLDILGPSDARTAKKESQFFLRGSFGEDTIQNAFYGSETYEEAIRDVKLLFPEGVCCPPTIDLKAEEIPCLALDDIFSVTTNRTLVELTTQEQTQVDTPPGMTLLPSSLLEINCLLLLPQLLAYRPQQGRRTSISYAEVIEALLTAGFHFIGLRMLLLGVAEAADCAKLYSGCLPADWKPHLLAGQLSKTPCLVMAVLRDGAVTCYDTLCDSSPKLRSLTGSSGKCMLAGKTLKEAKRMVECFFDRLIPNRKARLELSTA